MMARIPITALGLALAAAAAPAQPPQGAPVTLRGEVVRVDTMPAMGPAAHGATRGAHPGMRPGAHPGMGAAMGPGGGAGRLGVHLAVRTANDSVVTVALGPATYLARQSLRLAAGDRVEVRGTRMTIAGAPGVVASEVRRGDAVLALRDARGMPLWRGQGAAPPTGKP
jgi:hypothetical protein